MEILSHVNWCFFKFFHGTTKLPNQKWPRFMEFHRTLRSYLIWPHMIPMEKWNNPYNPTKHRSIRNGDLSVPMNSMEFDDIWFGDEIVPRNIPCNSMEYVMWNGATLVSWNAMELSKKWNGPSRVPWISIENSMGVQVNLMPFRLAITMFRGIPWNLMIFDLAIQEFHGIPWNIPWNSKRTDVK